MTIDNEKYRFLLVLDKTLQKLDEPVGG